MSYHLTYLEAVVTGLIQGVTELFPVSSLGHNVLIPAVVGGTWAKTLDVQAKDSPYLAFVVGLHVATAIAMIAFFWRDWLRIIRGFFSSLRHRSAKTPDERLAWMIILATIPVGLVGALLQKVFVSVFAKPELAALFLAVNGVILLGSERMRRSREATGEPVAAPATVPTPEARRYPPVPPGYPQGGQPRHGQPQPGYPQEPPPGYRPQQPPQGYSQQPRQQQWQGPDPRYGQGPQFQPRPGQPGPYDQGQYRQPRPQQSDPRQSDPRQSDPRQSDPRQSDPRQSDPRQPGPRQPGRHSAPPAPAGRAASEVDAAVTADRRLSTMGYKRAVIIGSLQILALLPGISRDGIVTVGGMWRGLRRDDAVRFSFLLSAPVILAAGALKAKDLTGPMSAGMHGPILVGSIISGVGAYLSIRFLTKYFSEDKSLNPFGIYCLVAGLAALVYLLVK